MGSDSDFLSITLCPKELTASESDSDAVLNAHSEKQLLAPSFWLLAKSNTKSNIKSKTKTFLPQIDSDERRSNQIARIANEIIEPRIHGNERESNQLNKNKG